MKKIQIRANFIKRGDWLLAALIVFPVALVMLLVAIAR